MMNLSTLGVQVHVCAKVVACGTRQTYTWLLFNRLGEGGRWGVDTGRRFFWQKERGNAQKETRIRMAEN